EDRYGDLWATLETGEVVRRHDGHFTTYGKADGLSGDTSPKLGGDSQGNLIISYWQLILNEQATNYTRVKSHSYRWLGGKFQPAPDLGFEFSLPPLLAGEVNRFSSNLIVDGDYWLSTSLRTIRLRKDGGADIYTEQNG